MDKRVDIPPGAKVVARISIWQALSILWAVIRGHEIHLLPPTHPTREADK